MDEKPRGRFSAEEVSIIKGTFKNNPTLLRLLRKVFLPEQVDESLPIGQVAGLWMDVNFREMDANDIKALAIARQEIVKMTEFYLLQLQVIADGADVTTEELAAVRAKNSAK